MKNTRETVQTELLLPAVEQDGQPIVIGSVFDLIIAEYQLLNRTRVKDRPSVEQLIELTFAASQSPLMQEFPENKAKKYTDIFPGGDKNTPNYEALADYVRHISTQTKSRVRKNLEGFAKKIAELQPVNTG